jgi:hypothetical protein
MTRSKPVTIAQAYERMKLGYSVDYRQVGTVDLFIVRNAYREWRSAHRTAAEATRAYVEITEREMTK